MVLCLTRPVRSLGSSLAGAANNRYLIQTGCSPKDVHFPSFKASVWRKARPQQGSLRDHLHPHPWLPPLWSGLQHQAPHLRRRRSCIFLVWWGEGCLP